MADDSRSARLADHLPEYLIEGLSLGLFMVSAGLFSTALEAQTSWLRTAIPDGGARRALAGLAMGLTAVALIYSPWGRRSGAHMNPAVTLAFLRLKRMRSLDALAYIFAQFTGGLAGVFVARLLLGARFTSPPVSWVLTLPGAAGLLVAFVAEAAISAGLMYTVLRVSASPRHAGWTRMAVPSMLNASSTAGNSWRGSRGWTARAVRWSPRNTSTSAARPSGTAPPCCAFPPRSLLPSRDTDAAHGL